MKTTDAAPGSAYQHFYIAIAADFRKYFLHETERDYDRERDGEKTEEKRSGDRETEGR